MFLSFVQQELNFDNDHMQQGLKSKACKKPYFQ